MAWRICQYILRAATIGRRVRTDSFESQATRISSREYGHNSTTMVTTSSMLTENLGQTQHRHSTDTAQSPHSHSTVTAQSQHRTKLVSM